MPHLRASGVCSPVTIPVSSNWVRGPSVTKKGASMPDSPEELAAKARFVFRGTVQQLHAANLPEVKDTSNTATVRVDDIVHAPKSLSSYTGKTITVKLDDA